MCHKQVIGGTLFPHRRIHKATWMSPNHSTENQIDHVCISRKFGRSLQDVSVKRGANVASDCHLVVARLKLKLKMNWNGEACQRFNITMLKNIDKLEEYRLVLTNRFQFYKSFWERRPWMNNRKRLERK